MMLQTFVCLSLIMSGCFFQTKDEVFIILRKESSVEKVEVQVTDFALERKIENIRQINTSTFAFSPSGNPRM